MNRVDKTAVGNSEWEKALALGEESFFAYLTKHLDSMENEERYEVCRRVLSLLVKTEARNLVRLLFAGREQYLYDKLAEKNNLPLTIECLGFLPSRETVERLADFLSYPDETVQLIAAGALKLHTPRLVVPCLIEALLAEKATPARIGDVLLSMGYLAEEALLEAYPHAHPLLQAQILEILILSENPKCHPFAAQGLRSDCRKLQVTALEAAAAFNLREYWTDVLECLASSDWTVRVKALEVLEKLEVKEAAGYVELFLEDENGLVRECAAQCLHRLVQSPEAGPKAAAD